MTSLPFVLGHLSLVLGLVAVGLAGEQPAIDRGQGTRDDIREFVFLTEARPLLVRLRIQVDGQPIQAAFDGFMKHLFGYLDVNGDGVLDKAEAERVPPLDQLLSGGLGRGFGGFGRTQPQVPTLDALDTDKDGKVNLAELTAYYRKNGFAPFQVQTGPRQANPLGGAAAFLGGPRPEPSVKEVSEASFALLDTNRDGKLTRQELAAARDTLLRLDQDEDETVSTRELVPNPRASNNPFALPFAMGRPGGSSTVNSNILVLVPTPGEAPADLVRRLQERYGPRAEGPEKKLTRKALGLDEATYAQLDADCNGVLDETELTSFVKRPPDVELMVRLGRKEAKESRIELLSGTGQPSPLASKITARDGLALLDLGITRVDFRTSTEQRSNQLAGLLRQQYSAQFKQADADGNGVLDEKEASSNRLFRTLFKAIDRDGDGKVSEKDLNAYLDQLRQLQARASGACVSMILSDESRGLFDLLDTNRDGRLSLRELNQAPKLLDQLDLTGKGAMGKEDIPHSYRLTLRRGSADTGNLGAAAAVFEQLYGGSGGPAFRSEPTGGPLWFRKMDRNRDGDVSRKEFLGSDEAFRRIDTDNDGLISREEAEKADAQDRKTAESNR